MSNNKSSTWVHTNLGDRSEYTKPANYKAYFIWSVLATAAIAAWLITAVAVGFRGFSLWTFVFIAINPFISYFAMYTGNYMRVHSLPNSFVVRGGAWIVFQEKVYWKYGPQILAFILANGLSGGIFANIIGSGYQRECNAKIAEFNKIHSSRISELEGVANQSCNDAGRLIASNEALHGQDLRIAASNKKSECLGSAIRELEDINFKLFSMTNSSNNHIADYEKAVADQTQNCSKGVKTACGSLPRTKQLLLDEKAKFTEQNKQKAQMERDKAGLESKIQKCEAYGDVLQKEAEGQIADINSGLLSDMENCQEQKKSAKTELEDLTKQRNNSCGWVEE